MSFVSRLRRALSVEVLVERRNARSLASKEGLPRDAAAWIVHRSRAIGYPQARAEYDAYARRARPAADGRVDEAADTSSGLPGRPRPAGDETGP